MNYLPYVEFGVIIMMDWIQRNFGVIYNYNGRFSSTVKCPVFVTFILYSKVGVIPQPRQLTFILIPNIMIIDYKHKDPTIHKIH